MGGTHQAGAAHTGQGSSWLTLWVQEDFSMIGPWEAEAHAQSAARVGRGLCNASCLFNRSTWVAYALHACHHGGLPADLPGDCMQAGKH